MSPLEPLRAKSDILIGWCLGVIIAALFCHVRERCAMRNANYQIYTNDGRSKRYPETTEFRFVVGSLTLKKAYMWADEGRSNASGRVYVRLLRRPVNDGEYITHGAFSSPLAFWRRIASLG